MSLRWIEREGVRVLQHLVEVREPYNFGTIWQDVPTHKEPKVDMLVEELVHGFRNYAQIGKNYEWSLADYAVKFFKARMPKREFADHYSQVIYNQALKDVRKVLFGEE